MWELSSPSVNALIYHFLEDPSGLRTKATFLRDIRHWSPSIILEFFRFKVKEKKLYKRSVFVLNNYTAVYGSYILRIGTSILKAIRSVNAYFSFPNISSTLNRCFWQWLDKFNCWMENSYVFVFVKPLPLNSIREPSPRWLGTELWTAAHNDNCIFIFIWVYRACSSHWPLTESDRVYLCVYLMCSFTPWMYSDSF